MTDELGGPAGYEEWRPDASLRRYVACTWTGGLVPGQPGSAEPVLPDGCMDVIWDGSRLFVAGPDTRPKPTPPGGRFHVGLRFRPAAGPSFLGAPADALCDQQIDLRDLWPGADRISDALAAAPSLRQAAGVLEEAAAARLAGLRAPDPVVEAAARSWSAPGGSGATAGLADRAGLSERQLHRRFVAAVGYGPKFLQRVLRFQAFLGSSGRQGTGLAELAALSGYSDQSHLTREVRALSGLTPARLRAARVGVRNVQDGRGY